jgi:hypothetical protein
MKSKILIFSSLLILGISTEARAQWNLGGNTLGVANSIGSNDPYDVFFETNGIERMRITYNATTPKVDIHPNNNAASIYFTATTDQYPRVYMGGNSSTVAGLFMRSNTNAAFYFGEDTDPGATYFRGTGNFGIGTSTPHSKLHVTGSIRATSTTNSSQFDLILGSATINSSLEMASGGTATNQIDFKGSGNLSADFVGRISYADGTGFAFQTAGSATNKMVITDAGNVGIGSSTPVAKLTVKDGTNNNLSISSNTTGYPTGGIFIKSHDDANVASGEILFQAQQYTFTDGPVKIGNNISATNHWYPGCVTNCNYSLYVQNGILTERVKVAVHGTTDWSDFVFADDYELPTLESVEEYIVKNKHLQGISSAEEMVAVGNDLGTTDKLLLEKIENLYLYTIELNKQIKTLTDQANLIELLKAQNELLKSQNELLILQKDEKK